MTPLHILGETAYPAIVPSARVRIAGFAPALRALDVDLVHRPTLTDAEYAVLQSTAAPVRKAAVLARSAARSARARRPNHDLLLVHRLRLLSAVPGIDPPSRLDVYDLDDALFLGDTAAVNRRFAHVKQEARRCVACLRRARLVLAGNEWLATRARELGATRVEVMPSCVDPSIQPTRRHADGDELVVGWIGSPTTAEYLRSVVPAIAAARAAGVALRLVVVGADVGLDEPWIEQRPWSLETQAGDLASFDVGIMPLPDTDWSRGKCGYKLLQYFSAGVPAIASPVGVNRELIGDDRGLLAAGDPEWTRALRTLAADPAERRERGAAARRFVEERYSYESRAGELAGMLRELAA